MNNENMSLIYVWDAYCGWCYGFSKGLNEFHNNHPELPVTVLSGGLFIDERALPIKEYPHIPNANKRISEMTGAVYGDAYQSLLADGSLVLDSVTAAIGYAALTALDPKRNLEFASAMQHAFYFDGKSLSDENTFREIAVAKNLDPEAVIARMRDKDAVKNAREEFEKVRKIGVSGYPTLVLKNGNSYTALGSGASTVETLEARLQEVLRGEAMFTMLNK